MTSESSNHPAAGKPGIARQLPVEPNGPDLPEPGRFVRAGNVLKEKLEIWLCSAGLIALLYVGAYFALARHGATIVAGGKWTAWPRYAPLPDSLDLCFQHLHEWDRSWLRPGFWAGALTPEEARERQLLASRLALEAARASETVDGMGQ